MLQDFRTHFLFIAFAHLGLLWGLMSELPENHLTLKNHHSKAVSSIHLSLTRSKKFETTKKLQKPETKTVSQSELNQLDPVKKILDEPSVVTSDITELEKETQRALFKKELRAEIEKNKSYPSISKRLGQTGVVEVAFTLLEDGHIINVRLSRPSPFERLNESALEAVRKLHLFRPIPKEWREEKMDLLVSLKFIRI